MSRETANMAVVEIGLDQLATLLQLPADQRVVGVVWDMARDAIAVKVEGPGLPLVRRGEVLQTVRPSIHQGAPRLTWPTHEI